MPRLTRTVTALLLILLGGLLAPAAGLAQEAPEATEPDPPELLIGEFRGGPKDALTVSIRSKNLPPDTVRLSATLQFASDVAGTPEIVSEAGPEGARLEVNPHPDKLHAWNLVWTAPEGGALAAGAMATVTLEAAGRMVPRQPVNLAAIEAELADGRVTEVGTDPSSLAVSLISDPLTLLAFLSGLVALIFLLAEVKALEKFFTYCPPLIWMYFVPMVMTTIGVTPDTSTLYSPFMSRVMLPAILVLLLIPSDVKSLAKLGPKALAMMLFATTGIVVGAIVSFGFWNTVAPDHIPPGMWKGVAALAGSWIGGSTNMFAVLESVGTPPNIIGPLVIVDTVLAYSWLGLLIALVPYQRRIDKRHRANTATVDAISEHLLQEHEAHARCPRTADIGFMVAVALVVSQLCILLAKPVFQFFDATLGWESLSEVVSEYAWAILLITAAGLLLSLTKVRSLDFCGASSIGNIGLYLLLTSYGARANLMAIFDVPVFFGIGLLWLVIHVAFLYAGVHILKAPLFLGATSSMANIGGTASAPVVAAAYNQSMAPVGLLMAILGGVLGTPLALFVVGMACRALSGE